VLQVLYEGRRARRTFDGQPVDASSLEECAWVMLSTLVFIVFMRRPAGVPKRSAEAETPAALVRRPEIRTNGVTARADVSEYN